MIDGTDVPPALQAHHDEFPGSELRGGEIIAFPRRYRFPLPPDAQPNARERYVQIYPYRGEWRVMESDEGGGSLASFPTKREALAAAMQWLDRGDAVLTVSNRPLPEREA